MNGDLRILITPVAGRYGKNPAVLDVFRNLASGVVTIAPRQPAAAVVLDAAGHHELLQALAFPPAQVSGSPAPIRQAQGKKRTARSMGQVLNLRSAKSGPAKPVRPIVPAGRHEKGFRP